MFFLVYIYDSLYHPLTIPLFFSPVPRAAVEGGGVDCNLGFGSEEIWGEGPDGSTLSGSEIV